MPSASPPARRRWAVLAVLCLAVFVINVSTTIVNVALPTLVGELGASTRDLLWIVDAFNLAFAALVLAAGSLSDRFGRRSVIAATVLATAISFALFYAWASGPWLIVTWTIGLFSVLAADVLITALGAELFPTSHRSLAASIRMMAALFGGLFGLIIERELFTVFGAHGPAVATLAALAPLCLIAIWFLPEPAQKKLEDISGERA